MQQEVFSSVLHQPYPWLSSPVLWTQTWWAGYGPPWTANGFLQWQRPCCSRVPPPGERQKKYTTFHHTGKIVCGKTFRFLHTVGRKRVYNLTKGLVKNGLSPHTHSNAHRRPKHSMSYGSTEYRIAPNFRGIIFLWISWSTPRSWIFYLRILNFVGGGLFTSGACDALNIIPWMTLLAYFKKSNPSKAVLLSPTGPLSLQMPSFCIELVRWPTNAWQKSWREQATQCPSRPQN